MIETLVVAATPTPSATPCICNPGPPDWPDLVTAIATVVAMVAAVAALWFAKQSADASRDAVRIGRIAEQEAQADHHIGRLQRLADLVAEFRQVSVSSQFGLFGAVQEETYRATQRKVEACLIGLPDDLPNTWRLVKDEPRRDEILTLFSSATPEITKALSAAWDELRNVEHENPVRKGRRGR